MTDFTSPGLGADHKFADEEKVLAELMSAADISARQRAKISARAERLVTRIRREAKPSLMEHFLAEYGLSSREGVAIMCLAEAMLRVPDAPTIDALIEDKIAPSEWSAHVGTAASSLVNASTWALMLTGKVLDAKQPGLAGVLRGAVRRLGEPVIRGAVARMMREMGRQFVLGETIERAMERAKKREAEGYSYSYDMLGEAARTKTQAARYLAEYHHAIEAIGARAQSGNVHENPGISVKFSALHPRYEVAQETRVLAELVPDVLGLARAAKEAGLCTLIASMRQKDGPLRRGILPPAPMRKSCKRRSQRRRRPRLMLRASPCPWCFCRGQRANSTGSPGGHAARCCALGRGWSRRRHRRRRCTRLAGGRSASPGRSARTT